MIRWFDPIYMETVRNRKQKSTDAPFDAYDGVRTVYLSEKKTNGTKLLVRKGQSVKYCQPVIRTVIDGEEVIRYSSVSGKVQSTSNTDKEISVVIDNDSEYTVHDGMSPYNGSIREISPDGIISHIAKCGIRSSDGEEYLFEKLRRFSGNNKYMILDCIDSEPYEHIRYRITSDFTSDVIKGLKILMKATRAPSAVIVMDRNYVGLFNTVSSEISKSRIIKAVTRRVTYPAYTEEFVSLRAESENEDLPAVSISPLDCINAYNALSRGMPDVTCFISATDSETGRIYNLLCPEGTRAKDIREYIEKSGDKIIREETVTGGGITGTVEDDGYALRPSDNTVIFRKKDKIKTGECNRCGMCVRMCPEGLYPLYISGAYTDPFGNSKADARDISKCTLCGVCSYCCPSGIDLTKMIYDRITEGGETNG